MNAIRSPRHNFQHPTSLSLILGTIGLLTLTSIIATPANAATPQTVFLDYAGVVAEGSTIHITRLPVQLPDSSFIFKDVTIVLKSSTTGVVSYSPTKPTQINSPPLPSSNFVAGVYVLPTNSSFGLALSGPLPDGAGGVSKWTLTQPAARSGYCGGPSVIYTGSVTSNPLNARLQAAHITSAEYSYGVIGSGAYCGSPFGANAIIGVAQLGNQIQVASFTSGGVDQSTPVTSYVYNVLP